MASPNSSWHRIDQGTLKALDPQQEHGIRDFEQRIANASPRVCSSLAEVLTVLRDGGNTVLHDGARDAIVAEH